MGAITISNGTLTGSVTVSNAKITENLRLFGKATIEGFDALSPQAKADAVAAQLYEFAMSIARQEALKEVEAATKALRDEALAKL